RRLDRTLERNRDLGPGVGETAGAFRAFERHASIDCALGERVAAADPEIGSVQMYGHIADTGLTGRDRDLAFGERQRNAPIDEGRFDPVANARGIDRQAEVDAAHYGREGRRIEPQDLPVLQGELAGAMQAAEERDRAAPGAFEIGVERDAAR